MLLIVCYLLWILVNIDRGDSAFSSLRNFFFHRQLLKVIPQVTVLDNDNRYQLQKLIRSSCVFSTSLVSIYISMSSVGILNSVCYASDEKITSAPITTRQRVIRATNNFLANNPVLETIRKIDQLEYDDSLAADTNQVFLLLPIVNLKMEIQQMSSVLLDQKLFHEMKDILSQNRYDKVSLKKAFNRYADNIFYTTDNAERANIYLAGGALPDTKQTEQYLLRNEILTNIENIKEDIDNLISNENSAFNEQDYRDAQDDFRETLNSFSEYFKYSNPDDLRLAQELFLKQQTNSGANTKDAISVEQ